MGFVCWSSTLGCSALIFYGVVVVVMFGFVGSGGSVVVEWAMSKSLVELSFPIVFDSYSVVFSLVVTLISSMVMLFSTSYMDSEENLARFIWLVSLFVVSMNFLIFVPSFIGVILGWDGLGLISFVLVMYYQSDKALGAGLVTGVMNRVGDAMLLLSVGLLGGLGHWNMWALSWEFELMGVVAVMVVLVSITKSAQMPFSYWLPAAMSAPTPVSALVHSSTLVTAGVYLLIRLFYSVGDVEIGGVMSKVLLGVSLATVLMSGLGACVEVDLKKVVALSTLSQLGIMVFALGMGFHELAFFHLITHALFKALLFLSVGHAIHSSGGSQELRDIGGLWARMPCFSACWTLSSMCLMGIPFLSGFYSKDLIIEGCLDGGLNWLVVFGFFLGVMLTTIYLGRALVSSVWGKSSGVVQVLEGGSLYVVLPGLVLGFGAVVGGFVFQSWVFVFNSTFVLESDLGGFVWVVLLVGVVGVSLWSLGSGVEVVGGKSGSKMGKGMLVGLSSMWFVAYLVPVCTVLGMRGSSVVFNTVDLGWNEEVFGGLGLFGELLGVSSRLLGSWRASFKTCLGMALILGLFMAQFVYP